ncbi:MAG: hypothetical protein WC627_11800 [Legionella sp.]|jgi:hypothetical protein
MLAKTGSLDDEILIDIIEERIDNPGMGNCAFYAFAQSLIKIIQEEHATKNKPMFRRWMALYPSIRAHYKSIQQFDFDASPDLDLLNELQHSLRQIAYDFQLRDLQQACAEASPANDYQALMANSNYQKFMLVCYSDNEDPRFNEFAGIEEIKNEVILVRNQTHDTVRDRDNAFAVLFLRLFYGKDVDLKQKSQRTPIANNSPIIAAISTVTQDYFWGNEIDLDALARAFQVNLHALVNGKAVQGFRDIPERNTITVDNHFNVHWTANVQFAKIVFIDGLEKKMQPEVDSRDFECIVTDENNGFNESIFMKDGIGTKNRTMVDAKSLTYDINRVKQLRPVKRALNELKHKLLEFDLVKDDEIKYYRAYKACGRILIAAEELCKDYKSGKIKELQVFQNAMNDLLHDKSNKYKDVRTLSVHRGFKNIILNLILAVLTLGTVFIYKWNEMGRFSLFHFDTNSKAVINKIGAAVSQIETDSKKDDYEFDTTADPLNPDYTTQFI